MVTIPCYIPQDLLILPLEVCAFDHLQYPPTPPPPPPGSHSLTTILGLNPATLGFSNFSSPEPGDLRTTTLNPHEQETCMPQKWTAAHVPRGVGHGWRGRNVKIQDGWLFLLQRGIHGAFGGLGRGGWRRSLEQEQGHKGEG